MQSDASYGVSFNHNFWLQQEEIQEKKTNLRSWPTFMGMYFGNRCNLRCKMCGNRGFFTRAGLKKGTQLSKETLDDIISYFPYLETLILSGGEPLVYKEFKEVLEIARKFPNIKIKLMTNGNLVNDYWVDKFCEIPFDIIAISLDAATDKTYRKIRTRGKFNRVLGSIENINESKDNGKPEIRLSYVVMKRNMDELVKFVELAHKYSATQITFQAINNQRQAFYALENVTINDNSCYQLLKICEKLQDLADDYKIKLINKLPGNILRDNPMSFFDYYNVKENDFNDDQYFSCNKFWKRLDISPDFYHTCCFSASKKYLIKPYSPQRTQKINEVWNSEKFVKGRELMKEHKFSQVCPISCYKLFKYKTKSLIS